MALSFSNHSLLLPLRLSSSKPTKTLQSSFHLSPLPCKPISGVFLLSNSFTLNNNNCIKRCSLKACQAAQDPLPATNDEEENDQNDVKSSEAHQKQISSLMDLLKVYKEAVVNGDEKALNEIEAKINLIENENNDLVIKVSTLSAEITSGKEKYIRLQADFDNFRKRSEKERINIRSDAQGEVIESLLPMVDNFERAKQQLKPETDMEKKIDTSYQGIYKQFVEIMRSLRVATVATVGKPFDPSLHEAIAREESEEHKEGIIIQEFRRGFLLGDRLLRPAMVKVSSGPGSKKVPVLAEKHGGQTTTAAGVDEA